MNGLIDLYELWTVEYKVMGTLKYLVGHGGGEPNAVVKAVTR